MRARRSASSASVEMRARLRQADEFGQPQKARLGRQAEGTCELLHFEHEVVKRLISELVPPTAIDVRIPVVAEAQAVILRVEAGRVGDERPVPRKGPRLSATSSRYGAEAMRASNPAGTSEKTSGPILTKVFLRDRSFGRQRLKKREVISPASTRAAATATGVRPWRMPRMRYSPV